MSVSEDRLLKLGRDVMGENEFFFYMLVFYQAGYQAEGPAGATYIRTPHTPAFLRGGITSRLHTYLLYI